MTLLAAISAKLWWHFAKEGEITDWNELPLLGKIGYKIFVFAINKLTGTKGEESLALLLLEMQDRREGC